MIIMIGFARGQWEFFAHAGDKVFIVEAVSPPSDMRDEALKHLVKEARWVFGDRRIIVFGVDDEWTELLHDGAGNLKGIENYDGPVPELEEYNA